VSETLRNLRKAKKLLALGGVGDGALYRRPWREGLQDYGPGQYCSVGAVAAVKLGLRGSHLNERNDKIDIIDTVSATWPEIRELAETVSQRTGHEFIDPASETVYDYNDNWPDQGERTREMLSVFQETIERLEAQS
jgi:hypothetical protein